MGPPATNIARRLSPALTVHPIFSFVEKAAQQRTKKRIEEKQTQNGLNGQVKVMHSDECMNKRNGAALRAAFILS